MSSSTHRQRLQRLYRNLQGLIIWSAKEYRELLHMAVLKEDSRPVGVP
jgi:hypothetical protein